MNKTVLIIILVIVLIISIAVYFRYQQLKNKYYSVFIEKTLDAENAISINREKIKISDPNQHPLSFTMNFWINVRTWEYKYGNRKHIIDWGGFKLWLKKTHNHIVLSVPTYKGSNYIAIKDIPIKKWVNITIILENRYVDLWLNGKLHTSIHLNGLPKLNYTNNMTVCDNGGFSGLISRFKYYAKPLRKKNLFNFVSIEQLFNNGPGSLTTDENDDETEISSSANCSN